VSRAGGSGATPSLPQANIVLSHRLIEEERPDLVFLDVQMPGTDGFEVPKALREPPPHVVFSTAYDEYAIRAFEVGAVDYLLKPFGRRRVEEAVGRVRGRLGAPNAPDWESVLKRLEEQRKVYVSQVPVHSGKRILIVPVTDVLWFEVEYRLVYAHTAERAFMTEPREPEAPDGDRPLVRRPLQARHARCGGQRGRAQPRADAGAARAAAVVRGCRSAP
jgi:DNA-binding LytR/AlgR family response regulator